MCDWCTMGCGLCVLCRWMRGRFLPFPGGINETYDRYFYQLLSGICTFSNQEYFNYAYAGFANGDFLGYHCCLDLLLLL